MLLTKKLISRIRKQIEGMLDLLMKSDLDLRLLFKRDLLIPSVIFIRIRQMPIRGGVIFFRLDQEILDGVLIIFSFQNHSFLDFTQPLFVTRFHEVIIVPLE